jgi:hypothetical protein
MTMRRAAIVVALLRRSAMVTSRADRLDRRLADPETFQAAQSL